MNCQKCGGRVLVDRETNELRLIDLSCIRCGKRTHLDILKDPLGITLDREEKIYRMLGSSG